MVRSPTGMITARLAHSTRRHAPTCDADSAATPPVAGPDRDAEAAKPKSTKCRHHEQREGRRAASAHSRSPVTRATPVTRPAYTAYSLTRSEATSSHPPSGENVRV